MDPRRLVLWNAAMRLRFAEHFETLPWDVLSEDHETSHHTIANVFMHGANMEDWWLHHILAGKPWAGPRYDGFTDARAMRTRVEEVNARTLEFLSRLTPDDLARPRDLSAGGHEGGPLPLADLLVEVVTEDTHHRGEILAMLWRRDLPPPSVSFLEWAAETR